MLSIMDPVELEDIVIFRDDEDVRKFYLLPDAPVISTDANGVPDFLFIAYRGADENHKEGGYLQFRTVLQITPQRKQRVIDGLRAKLQQDQASGYKPFGMTITSTEPVLADPIWTKGTVTVGTMKAGPDGLVTAGPEQPLPCDLAGALGASGQLSLSPDGATIFWSAFNDTDTQKLPIMITYQLAYRARVSASLTIDAKGSTVIKQFWERAQPKPYIWHLPLKRYIAYPYVGLYNQAAHLQLLRTNPQVVAMVQPPAVEKAVHSCVVDKTINVQINTDASGDASAKVQDALFKLATDLLTQDIVPAIFGTGQGGPPPQPQPGSDSKDDPKATQQLLKLPSEDTSTLEFHVTMNSNSVIERQCNPNGALQLLIGPDQLVKDKCFKEITLGVDFFTKKKLTISTAGMNFQDDGISEVVVSTRYTQVDEAAHPQPAVGRLKDKELKSAADTEHLEFALSRDKKGVPKPGFEYQTRVYYRNLTLQSDWMPYEGDAVVVTPQAMGALRVGLVMTARKTEVDSVSVKLSYTKASGEVLSDVVILTPDAPRQVWTKSTGEIAGPGAAPLEYTYQFTYKTLAAGVITLPEQTTTSETLEVPTPFPRALNFQFTPQGSFDGVAAIQGELVYEDPDHGYRVVRNFTLEKLSASYSTDIQILDGGPQEATWTAHIARSDGFAAAPLPPGRGGPGNHLVGLVQFPPYKVTIVPDVLDFDKDVRLAAVKVTYHDPVNGDVTQEMKFSKTNNVQQTWAIPQNTATSPKVFDVDVRYFAYDATKNSEVHVKGVTDASYYLQR
jgi:hypothetical protein